MQVISSYTPLFQRFALNFEFLYIVAFFNTAIWTLPSYGLLRGIRFFETDVSGLPVGSIFKLQTVQESVLFLDSLILEGGTDR
jgi:hypothetical protein